MELRARFHAASGPDGRRAGPETLADPSAALVGAVQIDARRVDLDESCTLSLLLRSEGEQHWDVLERWEVERCCEILAWVPPTPARRLRLQLEPHGATEVRPWLKS